ncbi:hypothetical protein ACODT3_10695 [Streptomyces sp. 4.24]|uniref:hypothetical protein n=1 Tax=Streptomyces tritrimontium TaxID=3406573 RepID=UPI003BB678FA
MSATTQSGHSIIDQPATPATCTRDYQAAQSHRAESAGAQRDQLGSATSAQLHTHH